MITLHAIFLPLLCCWIYIVPTAITAAAAAAASDRMERSGERRRKKDNVDLIFVIIKLWTSNEEEGRGRVGWPFWFLCICLFSCSIECSQSVIQAYRINAWWSRMCLWSNSHFYQRHILTPPSSLSSSSSYFITLQVPLMLFITHYIPPQRVAEVGTQWIARLLQTQRLDVAKTLCVSYVIYCHATSSSSS